MKKTKIQILSVLCFVAFLNPARAEVGPADLLSSALDDGTLLFESRLRYEYADAQGLRGSNALTIRTRLGYETGSWNGFRGLLEFSNLEALGNRGNYNAAGTNPSGAGRTPIPDVPGTEVNRASLSFGQGAFTATAGRQRLVLDNARFVGNVGWRQREQTLDALTLRIDDFEGFGFVYGYIDQVNRVFGPDHPAGRWDSESHLINGSYDIGNWGRVGAYGYFLRFDNAPGASSDTTGLSWTGEHEIDSSRTLRGRLEYARQVDNNASPAGAGFTAHYVSAEVAFTNSFLTTGLGWEMLGSDGGEYGFATPLATLHAFNGWTDVFLTTPDDGLRDAYLFIEGTLPGGVRARAGFHDFRADRGGDRYGNEINGLLVKRWTPEWATLAKAAHFEGRGGFGDVTKAWLQTEYRY